MKLDEHAIAQLSQPTMRLEEAMSLALALLTEAQPEANWRRNGKIALVGGFRSPQDAPCNAPIEATITLTFHVNKHPTGLLSGCDVWIRLTERYLAIREAEAFSNFIQSSKMASSIQIWMKNCRIWE